MWTSLIVLQLSTDLFRVDAVSGFALVWHSQTKSDHLLLFDQSSTLDGHMMTPEPSLFVEKDCEMQLKSLIKWTCHSQATNKPPCSSIFSHTKIVAVGLAMTACRLMTTRWCLWLSVSTTRNHRLPWNWMQTFIFFTERHVKPLIILWPLI